MCGLGDKEIVCVRGWDTPKQVLFPETRASLSLPGPWTTCAEGVEHQESEVKRPFLASHDRFPGVWGVHLRRLVSQLQVESSLGGDLLRERHHVRRCGVRRDHLRKCKLVRDPPAIHCFPAQGACGLRPPDGNAKTAFGG